ncbi:conserved hypothetical protein [Ricinus communis]|uniref:Uncharacterized protein n=1 Tax=Ricinus communis TaxID=3988 RepID=B9S7A1_RICCO|nr:conserved hypothetical protein [Ricinus communis]
MHCISRAPFLSKDMPSNPSSQAGVAQWSSRSDASAIAVNTIAECKSIELDIIYENLKKQPYPLQ